MNLGDWLVLIYLVTVLCLFVAATVAAFKEKPHVVSKNKNLAKTGRKTSQ